MRFLKKLSHANSQVNLIIIGIVAFVGILGAGYVGETVYNSNKVHMLDRINTIAQSISASDIAFLNANESDLGNPTYLHVKKLFEDIARVNHDVRFVYLTGIRKDGEMFFYADSEDPSSLDYSPPGQEYPEATLPMFELFRTGESTFEISRDRWGYWASAYAPIVSEESGKAVALVGLDVSAQSFLLAILIYSALPLLGVGIILSLLIASQYIRKEEERALQQRTEFLLIASHEIRTPLTGIRWATENLLLKDPSIVNQNARQTLELIHQNDLSLIYRINNLLTITRLEQKKNIALNLENTPLFPLVDEIVKSLKLSAQSRNVSIRIDSSITPATIRMDIEQIRQVIVNLLSNAIKYSEPNTEVAIVYKFEKGKHHISITDKGKGIPAEELPHIFEGYHRTHSARHSEQFGTGLGLYLSEKIAKLHGGSLTVTSTVGETTTFTLTLPV